MPGYGCMGDMNTPLAINYNGLFGLSTYITRHKASDLSGL
jgi:hypothetical protein